MYGTMHTFISRGLSHDREVHFLFVCLMSWLKLYNFLVWYLDAFQLDVAATSSQVLKKSSLDLSTPTHPLILEMNHTICLSRNIISESTSYLSKIYTISIFCIMYLLDQLQPSNGFHSLILQLGILELGGSNPFSSEICTFFCTCHNFFPLSSVQIIIIPSWCKKSL